MCDLVLFALLLLFLCVFFLRYTVGESGMGSAPVFILFFILFFRQLTPRDAPPCVCLPLSLFDLIAAPLSLLLHFCFALWRTRYPCPYLSIWVVLHCLYGCLLALRVLYVVVLGLFHFCFLVFPPESLPGDDVLCRLLSRPLPSVCFLPCLFVLFCFVFPTVFVFGLFWYNFLFLVTTAGFVGGQLIM